MDTGDVRIDVDPTRSNATATEKTALVPKHSYYFYKVKRKRTEDAVDICEITKNGFITAVSAVKSSSICRAPCRFYEDHPCAIHFECKIVEPFGDEILTMTGYQNFVCSGSSVSAEFRKYGQLLGTIQLERNVYKVNDKDGQPVCTVVGPSRCDLVFLPCLLSPVEFRIVSSDNGNAELGRLGNKWEENIPYKISRNQFGLCLPGDLDSERQWLILGASLLVRWQFYRPFNNGSWCLSLVGLIATITVALVVAACMLFIYSTL